MLSGVGEGGIAGSAHRDLATSVVVLLSGDGAHVSALGVGVGVMVGDGVGGIAGSAHSDTLDVEVEVGVVVGDDVGGGVVYEVVLSRIGESESGAVVGDIVEGLGSVGGGGLGRIAAAGGWLFGVVRVVVDDVAMPA